MIKKSSLKTQVKSNTSKITRIAAGSTGVSDVKKISAPDFYNALQRSLDAMQRQLSAADNAFADFVVKEFKVDAAVQMYVNELGVLQLITASEETPSAAVSRLSLTLVAVAKASDSVQPNIRYDALALSDVKWLPATLVDEIAKFDIKTVSEFLGVVADARMTARLVSMLKVKRSDLGIWTEQLRLLNLPGMTVAAAHGLDQLGIRRFADLIDLPESKIEQLLKIRSAIVKGNITKDLLLQWQEAAKRNMT